MKKILLLAAALLAFAGCKEKEVQPEPQPQADEISVSPTTRTVGGEGGEVSVTVTSTADWTLASKGNAKYDWVTSSKASGKSGDKVVFKVDPNTDAEKTAEFIFSCGEAQATFTLTSTPQEVVIPTIEVTSEKTVKVGYEKGTFQVTLKVSETVVATDLKAESTGDWITFDGAAAGSSAGTAVMNFSYTENTDEKGREATLTISYPNADSQTVTVNQEGAPATSIVQTSPRDVELGAEAGTLDVTFNISADVDYTKLEGAVGKADWISCKGVSQPEAGKAVVTFEYQANITSEARTATLAVNYNGQGYGVISVTQKAGAEEPEPVQGDYVAYMKDHCASPAYVSTASEISQIDWNKPDVLKFGKTITVELLVKHDTEFETSGYGKWDGTWINTIFGIEGLFLIRQGDNKSNYPQWELVYCYSKPTSENPNATAEEKYQSSKGLPGGEWAHLAVVVDGRANKVTLYQNGEEVVSGAINANALDIDFTQIIPGWKQDQSFSLGRSSDNARDFCGAMSEVRLWNRALSQDEIKAAGHFYSVDPASNGLVAYWKMNEGSGTLFHDYTTNGNDLTAYKIINNTTAAGKYGLDNWEVKFDGWQSELPEVDGFPR